MAVEALLGAHERRVGVGDPREVYGEESAEEVEGCGGGEESDSDSWAWTVRSGESDDEIGYYSREEGHGEEGDDEGYEEDPEDMY